jgi:hypothetical protein
MPLSSQDIHRFDALGRCPLKPVLEVGALQGGVVQADFLDHLPDHALHGITGARER